MPPIEHVVVLMMENRSFDHMLGSLKSEIRAIDGLMGNETNPDTAGNTIKVQAKAKMQGQLDPDPNHDFDAVDEQIFAGGTTATMQGFVRNYYRQRRDVKHSQQIMYYFKPSQLPVLTTLAREFAVFNAWFSSIPGPTLCNRAFAHYGTSFGHVGMELKYSNQRYKSIHERLLGARRTTKLYYFDQTSSTLELVNLLEHQSE